MNTKEKHQRILNLNAHFAWALAMWGSADVAREESNFLLAPIGYYYSAFHSGFALVNTNHTIHLENLKQVGHSQLVSWLPLELTFDFNILREIRETTNYLGVGDPQTKLSIVRGHGFRYILGSKHISFFDSILDARNYSLRFIHKTLDRIEEFCRQEKWPGPKRGDDNWQTEYIDEDFLLNVIPRSHQGPEILMRAFSVLDLNVEYKP